MSKINTAGAMGKYLVPACILAVIALICFGRTLGSYFVADDFAQVSYASSICNGNWHALWANFTGNYMQIPVMKIYRPCLLLSFIFDYELWHTNAFGYFLTNILLLIATAVMLYVFLRELTRSWEVKRSMLFSFLSAALFVSSPLHCESISFVSGRDNALSALFYLLALWCFVRKSASENGRRKIFLIIGVISFWAALLSKEMAIGLPVVLTGLVFFLPELFSSKPSIISDATSSVPSSTTDKYTLKERLLLAFKEAMPAWLTTLVYLGVRFLALGTFTGGYVGNIGAQLMANLAHRWTNIDTINKIIYPINTEVYGGALGDETRLTLVYAVLSTLIILRIHCHNFPKNMLGFLILWTLTTIAPLYQMWALGQNLAGSRFFFFLTIPLAIVIPLLILIPCKKADSHNGNSDIVPAVDARIGEARASETLGGVTLVALVILSTKITYINNIPWVHAGKQTRAFLSANQNLAKSLPSGKKVALLGIPNEIDGAHIIYNGSTFHVMMSPPFSQENYTSKFITFAPIFYGASELINSQRLKETLSDPDVISLVVWNEKTLKLDNVDFPSRGILVEKRSAAPIELEKSNGLIASFISSNEMMSNSAHRLCLYDHGCFTASKKANPYQYDFVEVILKASSAKEPIFVYWRGDEAQGSDWQDLKHPAQKLVFNANSTVNTRVRLSDHWHWFTQSDISRLQLKFLPGQDIQIKDMRLVSADSLVPKIAIETVQADNSGVYSIGKDGIWLDADANGIKDCTALKIEISKPNYFFDGLQQDETKDATLTSLIEPANKGRLYISDKVFPLSAYYQLRALGLDGSSNPVGERSDPITISFAK